MGHAKNYLDAIEWYSGLSLEERIARGPFQPQFGLGHTDVAAQAVEWARQEARLTDAVYDQVKGQAVFALLDEGLSIRAIADHTGISKSEVGRIAKRLHKFGAAASDASPRGMTDRFRNLIRMAWGHR